MHGQWVTLTIKSQMLEYHFIFLQLIVVVDRRLRLLRVIRAWCLASAILFVYLLHFFVYELLHGASDSLLFLLVIIFLKHGLSVTGEHSLLFW